MVLVHVFPVPGSRLDELDGDGQPGRPGGPHRARSGTGVAGLSRVRGGRLGQPCARARTTNDSAYSKLLAPVDDTPVWSIVCFVVSRRARRQGIAAALLDAAIDYARTHGATMLEAYPVDTSGGRVPSANAYHGTLGMFERAGFTVVDRRQWNATTPSRPIVRLALDTSPARAPAGG